MRTSRASPRGDRGPRVPGSMDTRVESPPAAMGSPSGVSSRIREDSSFSTGRRSSREQRRRAHHDPRTRRQIRPGMALASAYPPVPAPLELPAVRVAPGLPQWFHVVEIHADRFIGVRPSTICAEMAGARFGAPLRVSDVIPTNRFEWVLTSRNSKTVSRSPAGESPATGIPVSSRNRGKDPGRSHRSESTVRRIQERTR